MIERPSGLPTTFEAIATPTVKPALYCFRDGSRLWWGSAVGVPFYYCTECTYAIDRRKVP